MSILTTVPTRQIVSVSEDLPVGQEEAFAQFTDPLRLAGWYGPEGWFVPVHTITAEPVPGGTLRLVMVSREAPGQAVPLYSTFVSVVPQELIEHRESLPGPDGQATDAQVLHRIEFLPREVEGAPGTRVVISQGPLPPEVHEGVAAAWRSSLRRLREALGGVENR